MVNIIDWAPSVHGQVVQAPHGQGGECVDLAVLWTQALGKPRVWADAAAWINLYDPFAWQRVMNSPFNFPPPGALVVWHDSARAFVGVRGHIAIAVSATPNRLLSLDQNWPEKSAVHYQEHTYDGVVGWLVPLAPATKRS